MNSADLGLGLDDLAVQRCQIWACIRKSPVSFAPWNRPTASADSSQREVRTGKCMAAEEAVRLG
jgi:hypothetical protein